MESLLWKGQTSEHVDVQAATYPIPTGRQGEYSNIVREIPPHKVTLKIESPGRRATLHYIVQNLG